MVTQHNLAKNNESIGSSGSRGGGAETAPYWWHKLTKYNFKKRKKEEKRRWDKNFSGPPYRRLPEGQWNNSTLKTKFRVPFFLFFFPWTPLPPTQRLLEGRWENPKINYPAPPIGTSWIHACIGVNIIKCIQSRN